MAMFDDETVSSRSGPGDRCTSESSDCGRDRSCCDGCGGVVDAGLTDSDGNGGGGPGGKGGTKGPAIPTSSSVGGGNKGAAFGDDRGGGGPTPGGGVGGAGATKDGGSGVVADALLDGDGRFTSGLLSMFDPKSGGGDEFFVGEKKGNILIDVTFLRIL